MNKSTGQNHLLFLAYGRPAYLHECTLALLSLCRVMSAKELEGISVSIYTDQPEWFASFRDCPLNIRIEQLDPAVVRAWRGEVDYLHRVKSAVINDFAGKMTGNVIFMDTDVWALQSLTPIYEGIAAGKRYMHVCEGNIMKGGNPLLDKTGRFLAKYPKVNAGAEVITFDADYVLWNSGVMGFQTSDKGLLESVLGFIDVVHPLYKKHITEQLAVSYYFGKAGRIHNATAYVLHYWSVSEAKPMFASFFLFFKEYSWNDLVHYSQLIPFPVLIQEKTSFYINRSGAGKVRRAQWEPVIPDWKELMRQVD